MPEQLAAVLSGRDIEPALAGAEKAALVGEAKQKGCLAERKVQPAERLLGQFTTIGCGVWVPAFAGTTR